MWKAYSEELRTFQVKYVMDAMRKGGKAYMDLSDFGSEE